MIWIKCTEIVYNFDTRKVEEVPVTFNIRNIDSIRSLTCVPNNTLSQVQLYVAKYVGTGSVVHLEPSTSATYAGYHIVTVDLQESIETILLQGPGFYHLTKASSK